MNIDESVFRMPIYSVQTNYIVMNIDESMFCIYLSIQCKGVTSLTSGWIKQT